MAADRDRLVEEKKRRRSVELALHRAGVTKIPRNMIIEQFEDDLIKDYWLPRWKQRMREVSRELTIFQCVQRLHLIAVYLGQLEHFYGVIAMAMN